MRHYVHYLLAGTLAVGGVAAGVGCDREDTRRTDTTTTTPPATNEPSAGQKTENALDRTGNAVERGMERAGEGLNRAADKTGQVLGNATDRTTEAARQAGAEVRETVNELTPSDAEGVYNAMRDVTKAAFDKDGLGSLDDRLSQSDQQRLGDLSKGANDFNARSEALRSAWQQKYGQEFDLPAGDKLYAGWVKVQNLKQQGDRHTATAVVPASHGLPEVSVPMVREGGSWRFDVADGLTADRLRSALLSRVNAMAGQTANWPADATEAYRHATHSVLMALTQSGGTSAD